MGGWMSREAEILDIKFDSCSPDGLEKRKNKQESKMSKFMGLGVLFAAAGVAVISASHSNNTRAEISAYSAPVIKSPDDIGYDFALSCDATLQSELETDDFSNLDKSNAVMDARDFYRVKWMKRPPTSNAVNDIGFEKIANVSSDECVTRYKIYKNDLSHG